MQVHSPAPPVIDLDLRGLLCPLPVLRIRKRLGTVINGCELVVIADDPVAIIDIPHFCNETGHLLLAVERDGDTARFHIRKQANLAP